MPLAAFNHCYRNICHITESGFQNNMMLGSVVPAIRAVNPDPETVIGSLRYIGLNPLMTDEAVAEKTILGVREAEALAVEAAAKS